MNEGMEIEVYHHSDPLTKVNTLNAAKDHEFLEELKSTGGGSFKINALDPKILANPNLLAGRNIFKLRVDGEVVSAFIREKRKKRIISSGERKDQDHTISGPGLKAWFDDAEVRPYKGLKPRSQDVRYFNFASERGPWYEESEWVTPVNLGEILVSPYTKERPEKWPEKTPAQWIWGTPHTMPTMPLGNCYFRFEITTAWAANYVMYTAADDNFTMYIDGEQRVTTDPSASALYETVRTEFTMEAGDHVIAYRAANGTLDGVTPRGPAAFVAALFVIENDKEVLVSKTGDAGWKVNSYPAEEPGWTAASVLLTLMAEAEARGVRFPTWLNPTFTHTHDSYMLPWTDKMPWSFKVGESLLSVLSSIEELIGDIWIDPDNYDMHFVPQRSFERSQIIRYEDGSTREAVIFTKGKNLLEADSEGRSKLKNALSVKTDVGWLGVDDESGSIATYGRLEGTLKVGAPRVLSEALADVVISQKRNEEEGATYVILPTALETPFVKFNVGDYVAAPNEANETVSRRVLSIAVKQSSTGQPEYSIEFDVIFRENEERVNRILNKIGAGGVGGGYNGVTNPPTSFGNPVVIPPPPTPPTLFPLAPTGLVVTSAGNWTPDGVIAYSEITLDWDPVTSNTDGSITTPEYYEIWGHSTDETDDVYEPFGRTTNTLIKIKPFNPGSSWTFKVLARNPSGEASAFSTPVAHTPVGPTAQMTAPSTPVVTSDKGNLIITWNGLLGGVAPPPQFRYVYAKVATTAGGSYTQRGQTLGRGGGNIVVSGLTVGQAYHVKLVAVDGAGITSPDSLSASHTLTGISLGSLNADVTAAITAAQEAADAAQVDADSAFSTATSAQGTANTALTAANSKNRVYYQTTMPTGGTYAAGDIWFDTDDGYRMYLHNGTTFVGTTFGSSAISNDAITAAKILDGSITSTELAASVNTSISTAQTTANSKNTVYYQTTMPTGGTYKANDIWFDTDDGNRIYIHNGTTFIATQFGTSAITDSAITAAKILDGTISATELSTAVNNSITAAQTSADGKNTIYYQAAMPTGGTYKANDVWFDTDDGNRIYIHNGTTFIAAQLGTNAIAALAITDALIANGTISNAKIATLDAGKITTGTLGADRIGANSITAAKLVAGTITAASGIIADAAITSAKIADLAVTNAKIADATIQNAKIATLDAAKITTGILSADRIGANTITASKLFVGDMTNLASDGNFTDLTKRSWGGTGVVEAVANEMNRLKVVAAASGNNDQPNINSFQVTPGEKIYVEMLVFGETTNVGGGGPNIHLAVTRTVGGTTWPSVAVTRASVQGAWTKVSGVITIPADAVSARVEPAVSFSADAVGNIYYFRQIIARRMASGELIVDGSVTATKMVAGTITAASGIIADAAITTAKIADLAVTDAKISTLNAGKITAGSLDAARIAAGTITAEKLAIGDASNMAEIGANPAGNTVIVSGVTHDAPGPAGGWFQRSVTTGQTHLFRNQKGPLPFKTGDRIRISFDAYASVVDNVQISLYVYGNASLVQLLSPAFDLDTVADTYTFESDITVDTIGKTSFTLGLSGILAGTQTYLRNVRVYRMNAGELVVDGGITADKLAANSVVAGKVAALAIAAENIQARTITAAQIASQTITAEEILARSIKADRIEGGSLTINEIHPSVGAQLNISANEAVNILVGQIAAVESNVEGVGDTIETLQTYYKFTAQGALIESPGSPYSIGIKSDRIQMLQNGVEVSYWNAGVMYVNSFVGESVILGNHQIVKSGTGTIVRKL